MRRLPLLCSGVAFFSITLFAAAQLPDLTEEQKAQIQQALQQIESADEEVGDNLRRALLESGDVDTAPLAAAVAALDRVIDALEQALPLAANVIDTRKIEAYLRNRQKVRADALKALELIETAAAAKKAKLAEKAALKRDVQGDKTYFKAVKPYFGNIPSAGDVLILEELKTRSAGFREGGETVCYRLHGYVGRDGSTLGDITPLIVPAPDGPEGVVAGVTPITSRGEFCVVLGAGDGPVQVSVTHGGKTTRRLLYNRGKSSGGGGGGGGGTQIEPGVYTGTFSGVTTGTLDLGFGTPCKLRHSISGSGSATVSGSGTAGDPYVAVFRFRATDTITVISGNCQGGVEQLDLTDEATVQSDGRVTATVTVPDIGAGTFTGRANGDKVTGTLVIDGAVFDRPISGPLTLTRQ